MDQENQRFFWFFTSSNAFIKNFETLGIQKINSRMHAG